MATASPEAVLLHHPSGSNYFARPDGTAVFLEGDHTWTNNISFSDLGPFDFGAYLNILQNEGANLIRYWMWAGSRNDTLHAGAATIQPFQQDAAGKWDLTRFNQSYFDHVARDVDAAAAKGIYVSVMALFDYDPTGTYGWNSSVWNGNNNVNGTPTSNTAIEQANSVALPLQKAYLAKLLDTLGTRPNVLWEIANEPQNTQATVAWENTLVNFIHQYQADHGLLAQPVGVTASYPEGDQSQINPMLNATNADWIAPHGWQEYQSSPPDATGGKVQIIDTDHAFGVGGDGNWVWKQFTRGHGGVNIMDDMKGTGLGGVFDVGGNHQADETAERLALKEISEVVRLVDIRTMSPLGRLSSTGYALANPTKGDFVVLAPSGGSFTLDLSGTSGVTLQARWIDVRGGGLSAGTTLAGGNAQQRFDSPSGDAVLVLTPAGAAPAPAETGGAIPPVRIGTGPDTVALSVSEDAWQGHASFTVSVDGVQIGGPLTALASHAAGATQIVEVATTLTPGAHAVAVNFLNDAYGGTAAADRNLYVTGISVNGTTVAGASLTAKAGGAQTITVQGPAATVPPAAPTSPAGTANTLTLLVSEDSWQGDAQFTVAINGTTIGGVHTVTASHAAGATQTVSLAGNWGSGANQIGISFINDAYGGTVQTDRNLYVDRLTYDGQTVSGPPVVLHSQGTANFTTTAAGAVPITVSLAQDAWQGDAQFSIAVDGQPLLQNGTVTASNALGQLQAVNLTAALSAGTHDLAVSYLNDAYGGTTATDRNLHVKSVSVNGATVPGSSSSLMSAGTDHFQITVLPG